MPPQDLFATLCEGWQALDCINLAASFHRLAQLGEAAPGGVAAFRDRALLGAPAWCWLLDQVPAAAEAPEFGEQCTANVLAALCKLDALSPPLLHALHAPLRRALQSCARSAHNGAGGPRFGSRGLTQLLWCLGKDDSLRPLLLALKPQLFDALWAAAPSLDARVSARACTQFELARVAGRAGDLGLWAIVGKVFASGPTCPFSLCCVQAVATAWWALGEASSRCSPQELHLEAEASGLLHRLAQAATAEAGGMTFQGLSEVTGCACLPACLPACLSCAGCTPFSRKLGGHSG